jgi:hypothetical protein
MFDPSHNSPDNTGTFKVRYRYLFPFSDTWKKIAHLTEALEVFTQCGLHLQLGGPTARQLAHRHHSDLSWNWIFVFSLYTRKWISNSSKITDIIIYITCNSSIRNTISLNLKISYKFSSWYIFPDATMRLHQSTGFKMRKFTNLWQYLIHL